MPKATLEFNLPEEQEEYETCVKAMDYKITLQQLCEHFRRKYKHAAPPTPEAEKEFDEVRTVFYRILNENDVDI